MQVDNNNVQNDRKIHVPTLILTIIGLLFSLILPIITYIVSIIALVFCGTNKQNFKVKYAVILNTIAFVVAVANSILGVLIQNGTLKL
jgi:hypothetical protein